MRELPALALLSDLATAAWWTLQALAVTALLAREAPARWTARGPLGLGLSVAVLGALAAGLRLGSGGALLTLGQALLWAGLVVALAIVAAWAGVGLRPRRLPLSLALGGALGLASVWGLRWAGTPTPAAPPPLEWAAFLAMALLMAVHEEVVARGVMQGWLSRWLGAGPRVEALAIALSTALWVTLHLADTPTPGARAVQLCGVGVCLGQLCARWGLPAAVAGHVGLNLVTVLLAPSGP